MLNLDQPVTFIPDVHGNDVSLGETLRRASGGGSEIDVPALGHVVFTGDLNDKGEAQYLKVLDRILTLQEQTRVTLCIGNHESIMLEALQTGEQSCVSNKWLCNGGTFVLLEIARRREQLIDRIQHDKDKGDFEYARDLLLKGMYHEHIFKRMCLMADVAPHVRAVHAGINEYYAGMEPAQANALLQTSIDGKSLTVFNGEGEVSDILWKRDAHCLTQETAAILKKNNRTVIVHGHKVLRDHVQTLHMTHGIAVMNGDVSVGTGNWGYIRIDEQGRFTAASRDGGERPFGELTKDGYLPPA